VYFGKLGVIYDSEANSRSAGEGALTGSSPCFPIGCLGVIYNSQPQGLHTFLYPSGLWSIRAVGYSDDYFMSGYCLNPQ
jgi:hypothetical protein